MIARLKPVPVAAAALLFASLLVAQGIGPNSPASATAVQRTGPSNGPRRLEILFLGHTGPVHDSTRFAPMLKAALAQYGFNFSYTTDPADLNAANLAKYDALMIYANHETIAPDQEKALLDFVAGGKGFLPIHSASSLLPEFTGLHRARRRAVSSATATGEFTTTFVNPSHPVLEGHAAVPGLGRDLRPHQAQSDRPHRPDGTRRRGGPRAVDVGANAGQGAGLLHRLRPRRAGLEQPELPHADQERDHVGGRTAGRRRSSPRSTSSHSATPTASSPSRTTSAAIPRRNCSSRSRRARRPSTSRFRRASSCSCSPPSRSSPGIRKRWPGTSAGGCGSPRRRTIRTTCSRPARATTSSRFWRTRTTTAAPTRRRSSPTSSAS